MNLKDQYRDDYVEYLRRNKTIPLPQWREYLLDQVTASRIRSEVKEYNRRKTLGLLSNGS